MVINSQTFVFIFLPIVFLLNALVLGVRQKWSTSASNVLLILASLVFYAWGGIIALPFLLAEALVSWLLAFLIGKVKTKGAKKALMITGTVLFIGALAFFKYFNVTDTFVPLGISFFTFSAVSYLADVYKGKTEPTKNFLKVLLYLSLFAKITAGPIVRYEELEPSLNYRALNVTDTAHGIRRFVFGLAKKLLIANNVALIADACYSLSGEALTGSIARLGAFAYLIQIYFDFSGYSDMAIGIGNIFGFKFCENFNYPYTALSVKDFWRRWHISVSAWFRDYLYIPLGGNRKGRLKTCINKIIVFFFTGLWHGANFTFVIWGLWHGLFLLLEEYVKIFKDGKIKKIFSYVYTMLVVYIGFAMFRSPDVKYGFSFIGKMILSWGNAASILKSLGSVINPFTVTMLALGIIFSFPIKKIFEKKFGENNVISYVITILLFAVCIISLANMTYNPFIYAQF